MKIDKFIVLTAVVASPGLGLAFAFAVGAGAGLSCA